MGRPKLPIESQGLGRIIACLAGFPNEEADSSNCDHSRMGRSCFGSHARHPHIPARHPLPHPSTRHQALPVAFEATVTYFRGYGHFLTVQDGDIAVFSGPQRMSVWFPAIASWCEEPQERASAPMWCPATSPCSTTATCPNPCPPPTKRWSGCSATTSLSPYAAWFTPQIWRWWRIPMCSTARYS